MKKLVCLFLGAILFGTTYALPKQEYETLANYLYYLTKYITWPETTFNSDEFSICVAHNKALFNALNTRTKDLTAAQMPVKIKEINHPNQMAFCQMVFIGDATAKQTDQYIKKATSNNALTISLQKGFVKNGGMVEFYEKNQNLIFDINIDQAQQAKYKVSAQLLRMVDRS